MTGVEAWALILSSTLVTVGIKAIGPVASGGRELPERVAAVLSLTTPAWLAALLVTDVFVVDGDVRMSAKVTGSCVALILLVMRVRLALAILAAVLVTAALRAT